MSPLPAFLNSLGPLSARGISSGHRIGRVAVDKRPGRSQVRCSLRPYNENLTKRQDLSASDARDAVEYIISGDASDAEVGAFLALLAAKGETAEEVSGVAEAMRGRMIPVETNRDVLDIVGTGGDGFSTVNISTAASILAAAAGCTVAKHGNRSVSSKSGSADVLEALGIHLSAEPKVVSRCIENAGIAFMFAQHHHPAMRYVRPARKALGLRTVFNIIGPLLNPCSAKYAVIGVYSPSLLDKMADVLISHGVKKAVVVHTAGLDEFSNTGVSEVVEIDGKSKKRTTFDPLTELGMPRATVEDLKGGDANHNAKIIRNVLSGDLTGPITDAILLNAAVGCYVYGLSSSIKEGLQRVEESIKSGDALRTLEEWSIQSKPAASQI